MPHGAPEHDQMLRKLAGGGLRTFDLYGKSAEVDRLPDVPVFNRLKEAVRAIDAFASEHPARMHRISLAFVENRPMGDAEWVSLSRTCTARARVCAKPAAEELARRNGHVVPTPVNERRLTVAREVAGHLRSAFGVRGVYLVGSVAQGRDSAASDIDLAVHVEAGWSRGMSMAFQKTVATFALDVRGYADDPLNNLDAHFQGERLHVVLLSHAPTTRTGFEGALAIWTHGTTAETLDAWADQKDATRHSTGLVWPREYEETQYAVRVYGFGAVVHEDAPHLFTWDMVAGKFTERAPKWTVHLVNLRGAILNSARHAALELLESGGIAASSHR